MPPLEGTPPGFASGRRIVSPRSDTHRTLLAGLGWGTDNTEMTDSTEKPGALVEEALTRSVLGAFFESYGKLGYGFSEKVCIAGLVVELERRGHRVERERRINVHYDGRVIGTYSADLVVDDRLLVEVKAEACITGVHARQLRNYLASTRFQLGLILCYGLKPQFKRMIHTLDRKAASVLRGKGEGQ